ncbi:uncharacterized protein [Arachis hypogaea]|uniref:uncharacterized protein n=1 Tax=Arachis hypogaea TaxID=3818 RepID=UPI003B21B4DD
MILANTHLHRTLVDQGSSTDILFKPAFDKLGLDEKELRAYPDTLFGLGDTPIRPLGFIPLHTTFGKGIKSKTLSIDFIVVDVASAYNALIGGITLNRLGVVVSTPHICMKFPTLEGIATIRGDQKLARKCYNESLNLRELSELDLKYETRTAIKAECLTDFVAEYTGDQEETSTAWELYVDGSSNKVGSGTGIILVNQEGTQIEVFLKFEFPASNNHAEYEALIAGLKLEKEVSTTKVVAFSDSQVVISQINGEYQAKDPNMRRYLEKINEYLGQFPKTEVRHITRELNSRADALSKLASTKPWENSRSLIQETLQEPSVMKADTKIDVLEVSGLDLDWMTPLIEYLKFDILLEEQKEAKKIQREAQHYTLVKSVLYKRGISTPLLKCVSTSKTEAVLDEVHNGICGNHFGKKSLARKVIRAGFFWPTLQKDAVNFVNKFQPYQMHANFHVTPPEEPICVTSPCPFAKWGLDLLGPFPQVPGQVKFLIVGVDYFTKWIESEPLATITAQKSRKFLYRNIITRFGVSHSITTDNSTQFTDSTFRSFMASMKIKHQFTSIEHPQENGQAKVANKIILAGLKKRLQEAKGAWAEELPQVLWAYRTTPHSTTGETPFRLAYGIEAVIPIEINEKSLRVRFYDEVGNVQAHKEELELLPEVREQAKIKEATLKQRMTNSTIKGSFKEASPQTTWS